MKVAETKVPERQKITPLAATKLMMKRVHLTVKPNITWLPVPCSRILSNIGDAASVCERIAQTIARNRTV